MFVLEQGLRQGYALFLLLFIIFFVAVLAIILQRLSTDGDKLASVVHPEKPRDTVRPERTMENAR